MNKAPQMQAVEASELLAVSGGGLWSWVKSAAKWVAGHFGYSGTDMSGSPAHIITVKGKF